MHEGRILLHNDHNRYNISQYTNSCTKKTSTAVHCLHHNYAFILVHKSRDVWMVFRNILFDVAPCKLPTPDYPPKTAVLTHSLRRFVAPSDTVRIQGNTDCEPHRPPILGRIISVTHNLKDWHESVPLHPDIVGPPGDEPMILLQLIVTKQQMLELNRNAN